MHTLPTETLTGLLRATLATAAPDPTLPAPLPAVLLAIAADGEVTTAATDAVVMAAATARPKAARQRVPQPVPGGDDDAGTPASAGMWLLQAGDAAVLLQNCAGAAERFASTTMRAGAAGDESALVFSWDDGADTTTVRLHPATPAYPDWRGLIPGAAAERTGASAASLLSATFAVADLSAAIQPAAMADAVTLTAQTAAGGQPVGERASLQSFGDYDPLRLLPILEAAASLGCGAVTVTKGTAPLLHIRATSPDGLVTLDWLVAGLRSTATDQPA